MDEHEHGHIDLLELLLDDDEDSVFDDERTADETSDSILEL